MKTFFKKAGVWLIVSSQDPEKYSLTLKGALLGVLALVLKFSGVAGITLPSVALTDLVNSVTIFVQDALVLISSAMTLWGLGRKIYLTSTGENKAIQ